MSSLEMRCYSPRPLRTCRKAHDDAVRAVAKTGLLPKEAYTILRAYSMQQTYYPTKPQLAELVEQLRTIPGCEDCQVPRLQAYFKERRKTQSRARTAAKFKAGRCPEPQTEPALEPTPEPEADSLTVAVEIAEADSASPDPPTSPVSELGDSASSSSSSSSLSAAEREPPSPSPPPSTPDTALHTPIPALSTAIPTTFVDLARWLEEPARRFRSWNLVAL